MKGQILVADDSYTDLAIIKGILSDYQVTTAENGEEAINKLKEYSEVDLLILDINMPKKNGFEVLEIMQKDEKLKKISVIILTNYDETENEVKGLELGAVDYIRKPLNISSLRKRVEVHLALNSARKFMEQENYKLEEMVLSKTKELVRTRDITIQALVGLLEARNLESGNHIKRTQWMMKALCEHLAKKQKYEMILNPIHIKLLFKTAPLHDIGKVGIPDNILLKPGRLTQEEFEIMKQHVKLGVDALSHDEEYVNEAGGFINVAIEIVATHHEKYDGTGYPNTLKGEEIPLSGRLMAIIDVYDALTSNRVYKPAFLHEEAMKIIESERGKHFDPEITDAFIEIQDRIQEISREFKQISN